MEDIHNKEDIHSKEDMGVSKEDTHHKGISSNKDTNSTKAILHKEMIGEVERQRDF